jgi:hypothetical protein
MMTKKHKSNGSVVQLTDKKLYALIRYLDPDPRTTNEEHDDAAALVISVILVILLLGLGFMLIYW